MNFNVNEQWQNTIITKVSTCINLNRTNTLSSVPSNSSSEVPLFPARSFSSTNLAMSSAGRFWERAQYQSVTKKIDQISKLRSNGCESSAPNPIQNKNLSQRMKPTPVDSRPADIPLNLSFYLQSKKNYHSISWFKRKSNK